MVIRIRKLIGKKIVSSDGKTLEDVDSLLFNPATGKVAALLVRKQGLISDAKIVLLSDIQKYKTSGIVVDSAKQIHHLSAIDKELATVAGNKRLTLVGNELVGEDHKKYGRISDVFFDTENGQILGLEYQEAQSSHRKTMKIEKIVSVDAKVTVVCPIMESKKNNKQRDIDDELRKRIEDTIGKYATKNILLPTDEIIIQQNEILTHESLRIAYTYGLLDQALQNASSQPIA